MAKDKKDWLSLYGRPFWLAPNLSYDPNEASTSG
jgi:hypothetical protein